MCLGIPGKVIEIRDEAGLPMGKVDFGGVRKDACLAYIPEVKLGDYVIVHVGFAISPGRRGGGAQDARDPGLHGRLIARSSMTMGPGMDRVPQMVSDDAPVARRQSRAAARGHWECPCVKYLDEYRDPVLAKKLLAEIHRITTKPPGR
jgi:hydrogenase assembly chaperone HypC/HupF